MTSNAVIVELLKRHVLRPDEQVVRVRNWPDGMALTTSLGRHLVGGSESPSWLVSREEWVDDVVIVDRDDLIIEGGGNPAERHGFLMLADGRHVYLNDSVAVAELGRRLDGGINPTAYAEVLVEFHPYGSAIRTVLSEPDTLRKLIGHDDVPDIEPPRLARTPAGLVLTFGSACQYRWPLEGPLLDLVTWTVRVPTGGLARWESQYVARRLQLDPRPGFPRAGFGVNIPSVDKAHGLPVDPPPVDEAKRIAQMWLDGEPGEPGEPDETGNG